MGGRRAGLADDAELAGHGAGHHLRQDRDLAAVGLAIVYFRFPFRMLFFWLIFITLMLPVEVRILPTYDVVARLGMLNSYSGLIIPLIASATATFLFRQFFLTIPDELTEAARIDRRGADALLLRHPAAAVAHQHRGALHHPLHLWLEPVSLAAS
jgi:hypothetical protein